MADITKFNGGDVNDSDKVNWRGDQASVPHGQSIYKTSSVPLAQLGARLVVGDRVFRYALAANTNNPGRYASHPAAVAGETAVTQTTAGSQVVGSKQWNYYTATALSANDLAEGYLIVASGTNPGWMYRIKSHPAIGTTSTGTLTLYDTVEKAANATDKVTVLRNLYKNVVLGTGTDSPMGVSPVNVTSGDYFWLQTWGPAPLVSSGAIAPGGMVYVGSAGGARPIIGTTADGVASLGYGLAVGTSGQRGVVFLTIAP